MTTIIQRTATALILGFLFWMALLYLPPFYFSAILLFILLHILIIEWRKLFPINQPLFWLLMPLYLLLPFSLLIALNHDSDYHDLLFLLFILVSSYDTGSYLVGNIVGKHKIAPIISPGKTWEGALGGYIFACLGLSAVLYELKGKREVASILIFTLTVCALSLAGDLFESFLKRRARIKDTGGILPGHGGFLDRFDGIIFAVMFFYYFREYIQELFF